MEDLLVPKTQLRLAVAFVMEITLAIKIQIVSIIFIILYFLKACTLTDYCHLYLSDSSDGL
jgi:hypothetical protein